MVQNLFASKTKASAEKGKNLLVLELTEIKEISEIIFKRIEKKIQVIEALEVSVDKKIATLERLIQRAESTGAPGGGATRHHEIFALRKKGLGPEEIAEVLNMPRGEVDLILALNVQTF